MKRFLSALVALLLSAAAVTPCGAAMAAAPVVTVMVYVDASDLEADEGSATADINEMLYANLSDNVNLILCTGGTVEWKNSVMNPDTNEYYQVKDGQFILLKDAGRKDMTRPGTLTEFIRYCAENYPADRYFLIMWDHGGGAMYGFGLDDRFGARRMMSVSEVGQAIEAGGVHFDFIGFDACLMATCEMALALADLADYMIASEEMEPSCGWYYTAWLEKLSQDTAVDTRELGRYIIDQFMREALKIDPWDILTMSMLDLDAFQDQVLPLLWAFADEASDMIDGGKFAAISRARSGAKSYGDDEYDQIDLVDFASRVGSGTAESLMEAVTDAVVYNRATRNMEGSSGLAIYFPYRLPDQLDGMLGTYAALSFDESYLDLIGSFATVQASGQYNTTLAQADWYDPDYVANQQEYLADHQLDGSELTVNMKNDEYYALSLSQEDWDLVVKIELQVYMNDGDGYIELGSDDDFNMDDDGDLIVSFDGTWIALNGETVPYYAEDYVEDGDYYCYTGKVPITFNGRDAFLILSWDSEHEGGYVRGVRMSTHGGASGRGLIPLHRGDRIQAVCHYYDNRGRYEGDYLFGSPFTYNGEITVSYAAIGYDEVAYCYMLEDIYGNQYYTEYIYESFE